MDEIVVAISKDMDLAEDAKNTLRENGIRAKIKKRRTDICVLVSKENYGQAYEILQVSSSSFFN